MSQNQTQTQTVSITGRQNNLSAMTRRVPLSETNTQPIIGVKRIIAPPNTRSMTARVSYDVASGGEIMPCNKIDKPLVVYRFSGNVFTPEIKFQSNLNVI